MRLQNGGAEPAETRAAIQKAANSFFGRSVLIEERLFQVLEHTDDSTGETFTSSESLLASSLFSQPAVSELLSESGVNLEKLRLPPQFPLDLNSWATGNIVTQFQIWFNAYRGQDVLNPTPASDIVRRSGVLSVHSTIESCFQALFLDDWSSAGVEERGFASLNDIATQILYGLGLQESQVSRGVLEERFTALATQLQRLPEIDPAIGAQQFVLELDARGSAHIRPFGAFGAYQLHSAFAVMRRPVPRLAGLRGFLGLWLVGAMGAEISRR